MLSPEMISISMSQIVRFISVAEFSSFTKAAEKLNLSQPVISKSIASLEQSLGIKLLTRDKGQVHLTPSGKLLFEFWRAILPTFEQNIIKAYALQDGDLGQLSVGIHNYYDLRYCFMPIVERFRKTHQNISLHSKCFSFPGLRKRIVTGELDIAFTSRFEADDIRSHNVSDLEVKDLIHFPLRVMMLTTNPLAARSSVSVEDLRQQRFIIHSPMKVPSYHTLITYMCMRAGFIPVEYEYVEDATSFGLSLIANDQVYIVDRAARQEEALQLKGFDLEGTDSGISLLWSSHNANPALRVFIGACSAFFQENPDPFSNYAAHT